ncbi:cytochrome bd-I oxidase subunit CydX [Vibrio splendidus]|nr:cyd operon protein YbgT [Vibrio splendidus 1F-157]PMH93980.1 cyd operon protein YbgT [Vibrio splendidus]PMJ73076.1 cyd operon protein YbgT [Vibrio splendidus]PMP44793.1 cyd operon protein YbgT [Vibrio splendidus]PTP05551.1 cytochrome bd-I oxidase subunit CydX [Vibrio splendidus]
MWYFVWILGLFLASAFAILNVINLEVSVKRSVERLTKSDKKKPKA